MSATLKQFIDWISGIITLATLFSYLPHATALLGFIWIVFRLYETRLSIKLLQKKLEE